MREKLIHKSRILVFSFCVAVLMFSTSALGAQSKASTAPKNGTAPVAEKIQTGGVMRIAHAVDADTLGDPVARPMSSTGVRVAYAAIETLVRYDKKGLPVPWLATSWKIAKDFKSI